MNEGERIIKLETQMDNIEKKVDEGFRNGEKQHEELKKMFIDFSEKSEERFASKWVENAVKVAVSTVCLAVIAAVVAMVMK